LGVVPLLDLPVLLAWSMATTWAVAFWLLLLLATVAALVTSYRRFFPLAEA
jgi:hypothetical protein